MAIIGINLTRINAEKKKNIGGNINISNNIAINNVEEVDIDLGNAKDKVLRFMFTFTSNYDPQVGIIELNGEILNLEDAKKREEVLKSWKADKKIPGELMKALLNNVLNKCNIEALILAKDLGLPPPVPLPRVQEK